MSDNMGSYFGGRLSRIIEGESEYLLSSTGSYPSSDHRPLSEQAPRGYSSSGAQPGRQYPASSSEDVPTVEGLHIADDQGNLVSIQRDRGRRSMGTNPDTAPMLSLAYPRHQNGQPSEYRGAALAVNQGSWGDAPGSGGFGSSYSWPGMNNDSALRGIGSHIEPWNIQPSQIDWNSTTLTVSPSNSYSSDGEAFPMASPAVSTVSMYVQPSRSPNHNQNGEDQIWQGDHETNDDEQAEQRQSMEDRRSIRTARVHATGQHVLLQRRDRRHRQQPTHRSRIDQTMHENPYDYDRNMPLYQVHSTSGVTSWFPVPNAGPVAPQVPDGNGQDFAPPIEPHRREGPQNRQRHTTHSSERRQMDFEHHDGSR